MLIELLRVAVGVIVRVAMLVASLIFLACVLAMALILMGVWLLRVVWAKLTGQPINPWTFQVNRSAMWSRFYRPAKHGRGQVVTPRRDDSAVIDVEPKAIKPPLS